MVEKNVSVFYGRTACLPLVIGNRLDIRYPLNGDSNAYSQIPVGIEDWITIEISQLREADGNIYMTVWV